jgi:hypothetical protein
VDERGTASSEEQRLIELIEADAPVVVSAATKERFLASMAARPSKPRGIGARLLRPSLVFALLLLASATTAATLGRRWIEEWTAKADRSAPASPTVARAAKETVTAAPVPPPPAATADADAPLEEPVQVRPNHVKSMKREDPSRVVAAVQALRKHHDPERAAKLLDQYLKAYPHGALAEEALALSIEAAADLHSAAVTGFAQRYLREYPKGRFRRTAEQALAAAPR